MKRNALAKALRGSGGGGSSSARTPIEAPDSLRSTAYARILDLVSEGEIYGFTDKDNPLSCIFLNETPVANEDGSLNFKNIQVNSRVGTQTQDHIPGFDGVESENGVGVEMIAGSPWTRSFSNTNLDSVRLRISTPQMSQANTTTGDITGTSVSYAIELQTDGGSFERVYNGHLNGKASSKYERSHLIDLPPATTGWVMRVYRDTPNSASAALANATYIESFAEIIEVKLRMPMSATVATVVDAEQFPNIPSRAFDMCGRLIKVPSNYNPDTRAYTGLWDGTFQVRYSNNPAWVFYDMALNDRYGLGHLVTPSLIDKWALYQIAQYCDELVGDGFGGMEPRFTCNVYLQTQNDALRVMQDLAAVFRGMVYAAGGAIVPVADMPADPVYTYTRANVIDGKFVYQGSGRKVRHTVALVSWNDMTDFCRAKVVYVDDPDAIARYGVQPTEVMAIGCTSESQARRYGRYILATERYETDGVSFGVGMDGTVVAPGKIINIADPLRMGLRRGGRVRLATANTIVIDAQPDDGIVPGDKLIVTLPNGLAQERIIQAITDKTITVTVPFSAIPVVQSVWAVSSAANPVQQFRVIAVTENTDGTPGYTINAVSHKPDKFAHVDSGVMITPRPVPQMPSKVQLPPTGIVIAAREVTDQNTTTQIVNVSWVAPIGATSYGVQWRQSNGAWTDLGKISPTNVDIRGLEPGTLEVMVVAINVLGVRSQAAYGGPYTIAPITVAPGYVGDLEEVIGEVATVGVNNGIAIAQEIIDRTAADSAEVAARAAAIAAEVAARAAGDIQVANDAASALLNEQLTREAAIATEQLVRQSADESLASAISSIVAGTGEQFDSKRVWYFDSALEDWTGNGGQSISDGWLKSANGVTPPYVQSPLLAGTVDGSTYNYIKVRARLVGTLVWRGLLQWITEADQLYGSDKQMEIDEPSFAGDNVASVDFLDIPWPADIRQFRLFLFNGPMDSSNYYEHDFVALGRPSPGASVAALQEETIARVTADAAEATERSTLAAQMRGAYTGTDLGSLTTGLLYAERTARAAADSAMASDIVSIGARITGAENDIDAQADATNALTVRVSSNESATALQADSIIALQGRVTSTETATATQGSALAGLSLRMTQSENEIDVLTADTVALDARMDSAENNVTLQATSLAAMTSRVSAVEGVNTSQSDDITVLKARVTNTEGTNIAQAEAINNTIARVTANEVTLVSHTASLVSLNDQIVNPLTGLGALSSAWQSLNSRVQITELSVALVTANVSSRIDNIVADNILSADEKPQVIMDYQAIVDEKAGIEAQAALNGITTELAQYQAAFNALTTYLGTLTIPVAWNNTADFTRL